MIEYADASSQQEVYDMWKTVFADSDAYMDIYFREKYRHENTLIYRSEGRAVASLQMLPYQFTFCGEELPVLYLSGVCTLPEARKKGYMEQLLLRSFVHAEQHNIPLLLLVPQEDWLLMFYDKFGFAQTFDAGEENLPSLQKITNDAGGNLPLAWSAFDALFRGKEMTVQKTFADFKAMVEEAALFDFPSKKNLRGMARIINVEKLLSVFAKQYNEVSFEITVADECLPANQGSFYVSGGRVARTRSENNLKLNANIRQLTQLLLGYHTSENNSQWVRSLFPEKKPTLHFMLE